MPAPTSPTRPTRCEACAPARSIRPTGYEPDDFAVQRFEDLVERYPDHVLNIEIKGSYPEDVDAAEELARILAEQDREDAAIVTAFDDELAEAFHEVAPEVAITPGLDAMTQYVLAGTAAARGSHDRADPAGVRGHRGADARTWCAVPTTTAWCCGSGRTSASWEDAEGYGRLLDLGVDGINAADPPTAVEVVRARS